jgi:DNA-directed RNA polymerase specialized sigma24 family protein
VVDERASAFDAFFAAVEPRLRLALTAAYGVDHGREAAAEALAWAWEHWDKVRAMGQPVAYLYRVGQSRTRRIRRPTPRFPPPTHASLPDTDPGLPDALARLSEPQRVAVLLIHGYGWPHAEVAGVLRVTPSTVATHLARGLQRLRELLEVHSEV